MFHYAESFVAEDKERLFRFLVLFARWECALKHNGFARKGGCGQAEPNWKEFACHHEAAIQGLNSKGFIAARDFLLTHPPKCEKKCGNQVLFRSNPRRQNETDADYLFRVVRDVRNNLFHGGKYTGGPVAELARDRQLIDSSLAILEGIADLEPNIRSMLDASA